MQNYVSRLGDVRDVLLATNNIRETQLNVLASSIATGFAKLQASVVESQQSLDASVGAAVSSATFSVLGISGALIVIGLSLAYLIGRLISSASSQMAQTMEQLARGDDSVVIEATDQRHELGAMARSLRAVPDFSESAGIERSHLRGIWGAGFA